MSLLKDLMGTAVSRACRQACCAIVLRGPTRWSGRLGVLILLGACQANPDIEDSGTDSDSDPDFEWERQPGNLKRALWRLPSSVAGDSGLAVHAIWPANPTGARYAEGAPVVVQVPGGGRPDTGRLPVDSDPSYSESGVVTLNFLFPGGTDGEAHSGGEFDYRGPDCAQALADVLEFASGATEATSDTGSSGTLAELIGYPVLDVGVVGRSMGGNLVPFALEKTEHPVAWYVGWENPFGSPFITFELGRVSVNPHYEARSCDIDGCAVDYTHLAIDPDTPMKIIDLGPAPTEVALPGTVFFDDNENGRVDAGEFRVGPYPGRSAVGEPLRGYFSPALATALAGTVGLEEPLATAEEATEFWSDRVATLSQWQAALAHHPELATMVLASEEDHAQAATDHPHVLVQLLALEEAGTSFLRLNPDSAYLEALGAEPTPDAEANLVWNYDTMLQALVAEETDKWIFSAAVREMADRAHAGQTDPDLDGVLWP